MSAAFLSSLVLGAVGACSGTKGELVVALQTDMSLPKDVDRVRVRVLRDGVQRYGKTFHVDASRDLKLQIPSTIVIVAGDNPNDTVEVQVVAFQGDAARTLNKTITTIPDGRVATLWVPIQWLCEGKVNWVDHASEDSAETACPFDAQGRETACIGGVCTPVHLDSARLPTFAAESIYGGAPGPGQAGRCFPTEDCFDGGEDVVADASCVVTLDAPTETSLNFAVATGLAGDGICSDKDCYVPMDKAPEFGWQELSPARGRRRFQLPAAACERVSGPSPVARALRASTRCESKTINVPTCGPWSSVKGDGSSLVTNPDDGAGGTDGGAEGNGGMGGTPDVPAQGGGSNSSQGGRTGGAGMPGKAGATGSGATGVAGAPATVDCGSSPKNGDSCDTPGRCDLNNGCTCDDSTRSIVGCADTSGNAGESGDIICGNAPATDDSCIGVGTCPEDGNCVCELGLVQCMTSGGGSGNTGGTGNGGAAASAGGGLGGTGTAGGGAGGRGGRGTAGGT